MEVQPNASEAILQDVDTRPWQILDTIALGNRTLNLIAPMPFSQAVARIEALTEQEPSDQEMPFLTVKVKGGRVEARYSISADEAYSRTPGHLGILATVRPVFRGYVSGNDQQSHLRGWFGVNTFARLLGFASLVLVVALLMAGLLHIPLGIGAAAWIVPAAFIVMCLLTRANGDDMNYVQKNLEYAMYGDSSS